ncbi:MAG: bifunctional riboflavin kinase/FAD synthetase [Bacteroidota bacterium]
MIVYEDIHEFNKPSKAIVTMGIFDGVHQGHQQLLRHIRAYAQELNGEAVIITFWPHPKLILPASHKTPIQLLTTFEEKVAILSQLGIDHLVKIRFTKAFSQLSAKSFVQQVLVAQIGMTQLFVGHDHRFGKGRVGNMSLLQELGRHNNFIVKEIAPTLIGQVTISSTNIRQLLLQGRVEKAQDYLGRPYEIECAILQQSMAGKHDLFLGLAAMSPHKLIPADARYMVQIIYPSGTDNGTLRITRAYDTPTMALTIPNYAKETWHSPSLRIQFKKNLSNPE